MVYYNKTIYSLVMKPFFDVVFASVLVLALSPVFITISILVKTTSKGKIFFVQERVGKKEKVFKIIKFRTMKSDVSFDINNPVISKDHKSLTKIGAFLRRTKLDELPQLFNILKLDMSFIGPRPFVEEYMSSYEDWERTKFKVKPGLTGWSQVHGNGYLDLNHRSFYDIDYVQNITMWTDLKILFKSVLVILFGERKFVKPVTAQQLNTYRYQQASELLLELNSQFDLI